MAWAGVHLLLLGSILCTYALAYHDGDFIPAARKAQFQQTRTNWHDLLGHHCPRFGQDRSVALPLLQPPVNLTSADDYRVQFSFAGERFITPWFKILGPKMNAVPMLKIVLKTSGQELIGVTASTDSAPESWSKHYPKGVQSYYDISVWPKYVLVVYAYEREADVDLDRGLAVLLVVGVLATLVLGINAVRGVKGKLAQFIQEMISEDGGEGPSSALLFKSSAKAE